MIVSYSGYQTKGWQNDCLTSIIAGSSDYEYGAEVIRYLLGKGADIHARTLWGDTAAHYAALYSSCQVLSCLVEEGCPVGKDVSKLNETILLIQQIQRK